MLSQISWAAYIETVVYTISIYYVFILYKYYRHDLSNILKDRQKVSQNEITFTPAIQQSAFDRYSTPNRADFMSSKDENDGYPAIVQALADETQAFIVEAGNNEFEREPLLLSLQLLISKYPSVKSSPYKQSIQQLIVQQCATICSVHLSEKELNGLWAE